MALFVISRVALTPCFVAPLGETMTTTVTPTARKEWLSPVLRDRSKPPVLGSDPGRGSSAPGG